jgi:hypothetical protein
MRALTVVLSVVVVAAAGCVSVRTVDPTSGADPFAALNRAAVHRRAIVEFVGGRSQAGDRLSARADSVVWYDPDRVSGRHAVPTAQVSKISILKRGWSVGRGVLFGLVGGTLAGAVIGGSMAAETDLTIIFGAIIGAAPGAAIGTGAGAVLGLIFADREEYVLAAPGAPGRGGPDTR